MSKSSACVLHEVDAVAFVGNDAIRCKTLELGCDWASVAAPVARGETTFVRLQCHLDAHHWLDADTVVAACTKLGDEWRWRLSFVSVREPRPQPLAAFIDEHRRRAQASGTFASPERRPASRPAEARARGQAGLDAPVSARELDQLFREALAEVAAKR